MNPIETINFYLALGTLAMQIAAIAFLALYFLRRQFPDLEDIARFLSEWGLWIGFVLTLGASAMTLYYSEILGIPPCPLCWWQRIFLYPQVMLFALALWGRDSRIALYSIALSILGALFALYHHVLQMAPAGTLPCPADGTVSCAQIFFLEFGYITYPMMALSLFGFLIVLMIFVRSPRQDTLLTYSKEPA
ncbi:MAG: disulfide bond formation protein B [bacterium]|nr:disulfide bond formation protein B [bacterium]